MDRRTFMKLMGGLASMPIVGRIAKPLKSETVQEGIAAVSDKGMQLYEMVVAKVMKEGKKIGESGRVDSYKHPDRPDITVDVNQTDGSAEIYFDTDKGSKGYAKIDRDMETGGTDLQEAEEIYKGTPEGDYYKDVEEGISGGIENLDEFTRLKKAMGGRVGYQTGGTSYNPRATTQDFANALRSVSAGTTYQQQRQAKDYARQEASNLLSQAMRSGNQSGIQSILQGIGGSTTIPGMQFNRSGNRITSVPATGAGRDAIINAMANQMLNTTSYGGGSSAPPKKSPLQLKIEENQRIYDEYIKNNAPQIGLLPGSQGGTPTIPKPEYEQQALLDKLTMLTPEEAFAGETFDTLSDLDQYNFAQAFTQFQPQLRDPTYVSPYGVPDGRQIFSRRYGIKDGGSVNLTIMTMPDISGSGVESLFKTR